MLPRHQIELFMTVAFALYLVAFFKARKHWTAHVILASLGFVADMYATYLMVTVLGQGTLAYPGMPPGIKLHGEFAFVAIFAFFIQAGLGLLANRNKGNMLGRQYRAWHIKSAKWIFLPIWVITYASGFALPFLV